LNGFVEIGQCAINVPFRLLYTAATNVGGNMIWFDLNCLVEIGQRSVQVPFGFFLECRD